MVWCPHHKSKDGSVNDMYMPAPHNHEEWQKKKSNYDATSNHRGKRERDPSDANNGGSKTKSSLTLALNKKLTTALVMQYHLSQNEVDALFTLCYQDAEEGN